MTKIDHLGTPRTDNMILARTPEVFQSQYELPVVRADFARQLERELIAATTPTAEQIEACASELFNRHVPYNAMDQERERDAEERLIPLIELVEKHTLESEDSFDTEDVLEGHYKDRDQLRAQLTALRERAEGLAKWQTGTPDVEDGCCERFWCCIEGDNGKQFHRHLSYANRHVMPLSDDIDDAPAGVEPVPNSDDEYYWTGWHEQSCDHCDTQWMYSGKVIAWMRLPKYDAAEGKGEQP